MISNRPLFYMQGGRRPQRGGGGARTALVLGALALLLILCWFFRAPLGELFWRLAAPVMRARFSPVVQVEPPADRDALYAENVELKRMLGRSVQFERVLAAVLMRPPATPYDSLVIDAGSEHGVAQGDVVAAGGVVLGEVTQVYARAARATLYSAPGEQHEVLLRRGSSTLAITLHGQGGGSLTAEVPAGAGAQVGDEAVIGGLYSGVVGRVVGLDRSEAESFSTLYFQLPVALSALQFVEVWKLPRASTQ